MNRKLAISGLLGFTAACAMLLGTSTQQAYAANPANMDSRATTITGTVSWEESYAKFLDQMAQNGLYTEDTAPISNTEPSVDEVAGGVAYAGVVEDLPDGWAIIREATNNQKCSAAFEIDARFLAVTETAMTAQWPHCYTLEISGTGEVNMQVRPGKEYDMLARSLTTLAKSRGARYGMAWWFVGTNYEYSLDGGNTVSTTKPGEVVAVKFAPKADSIPISLTLGENGYVQATLMPDLPITAAVWDDLGDGWMRLRSINGENCNWAAAWRWSAAAGTFVVPLRCVELMVIGTGQVKFEAKVFSAYYDTSCPSPLCSWKSGKPVPTALWRGLGIWESGTNATMIVDFSDGSKSVEAKVNTGSKGINLPNQDGLVRSWTLNLNSGFASLKLGEIRNRIFPAYDVSGMRK